MCVALMGDIRNDIPVREVIFDGAFSTEKIIRYLSHLDITYTMRCAKNRIITTTDGVRCQIQQHQGLKLYRNERYKTVQARYFDMDVFITAFKRKKKKGGYEIIYLISNKKSPNPREHVLTYERRWAIEAY